MSRGDPPEIDVVGKPTPLERKAREMATFVAHVRFPSFKEDPVGWKIVRHIHLNPWLGIRWGREALARMTTEDKESLLGAIKVIRGLYHKYWRNPDDRTL